jgi:hypothetical protein
VSASFKFYTKQNNAKLITKRFEEIERKKEGWKKETKIVDRRQSCITRSALVTWLYAKY